MYKKVDFVKSVLVLHFSHIRSLICYGLISCLMSSIRLTSECEDEYEYEETVVFGLGKERDRH